MSKLKVFGWLVVAAIGLSGVIGKAVNAGSDSVIPSPKALTEMMIADHIDHPSTYESDFLGFKVAKKFDGEQETITQTFTAINKAGVKLHYIATIVLHGRKATKADFKTRPTQEYIDTKAAPVFDTLDLISIEEVK